MDLGAQKHNNFETYLQSYITAQETEITLGDRDVMLDKSPKTKAPGQSPADRMGVKTSIHQ